MTRNPTSPSLGELFIIFMICPFPNPRIIIEGGTVEAAGGEPAGDAGQGDEEQLGAAEALRRPHRGPQESKQVR